MVTLRGGSICDCRCRNSGKLRRNHGHRYFDWELRRGEFRFFEHPINLARETALEGKYVVQTEEPNLSPVEAVSAYKELNEVERGFSHLKDVLELRPVYHQSDARVQAHVFVAALNMASQVSRLRQSCA